MAYRAVVPCCHPNPEHPSGLMAVSCISPDAQPYRVSCRPLAFYSFYRPGYSSATRLSGGGSLSLGRTSAEPRPTFRQIAPAGQHLRVPSIARGHLVAFDVRLCRFSKVSRNILVAAPFFLLSWPGPMRARRKPRRDWHCWRDFADRGQDGGALVRRGADPAQAHEPVSSNLCSRVRISAPRSTRSSAP
jgi:hypothetical protein